LFEAFETLLTDLTTGTPNFAATTGGAVEFILQLALAAVLGAVIAYHPVRIRAGRRNHRRFRRQAQAQILITVAGTFLVLMIGESIARAFGLVGLGSFIRYRTTVRDPVDTALMFLLIGVGMACGLGLVLHAFLAGAFLWTLLHFMPAERPPPTEGHTGHGHPHTHAQLSDADSSDREPSDSEPLS
jgi:uncharacterized membrane protein YhiD involved in acid resistance